MSMTPVLRVELSSMDAYLSLFGANGRNLPMIESELDVALSVRGSELTIEGEEENALRQLSEMIKNGLFDGCYVDGYLVQDGKITEQKAPDRKVTQIEKYEKYQQQLLDSIDKAIFGRAK